VFVDRQHRLLATLGRAWNRERQSWRSGTGPRAAARTSALRPNVPRLGDDDLALRHHVEPGQGGVELLSPS
jgi:hypothetical protein